MTIRELMKLLLVDFDYKNLDTEVRMEAVCCEHGHSITGMYLQDDNVILSYNSMEERRNV